MWNSACRCDIFRTSLYVFLCGMAKPQWALPWARPIIENWSHFHRSRPRSRHQANFAIMFKGDHSFNLPPRSPLAAILQILSSERRFNHKCWLTPYLLHSFEVKAFRCFLPDSGRGICSPLRCDELVVSLAQFICNPLQRISFVSERNPNTMHH